MIEIHPLSAPHRKLPQQQSPTEAVCGRFHWWLEQERIWKRVQNTWHDKLTTLAALAFWYTSARPAAPQPLEPLEPLEPRAPGNEEWMGGTLLGAAFQLESG